MHKVSVTILMCAYNAEKYISTAINSIINQSFSEWELLIADDCSTDNTYKLAKEFEKTDPRIKVFKHEKNIGYLLNTNFIWEKAKGKYITFQDADDWSSPERMEKQYVFLENNLHVDICSTNYYRVNNKGAITQTINLSTGKSFVKGIEDFKNKIGNFPIFPGTLFFRKSVSDNIGKYNPFFSRKCGEDTIWILVAYKHYRIELMEEFFYYYRENSDGVTQQITIEKLIVNDLVIMIDEHHVKNNVNLLDGNHDEELKKLEANLLRPYNDDSSILPYAQACAYIYHKEYQLALPYILSAIIKKPFHLKYYKTLKFMLAFYFKKRLNYEK
jgi:glycosyltransferase involved in cell wall biosynthesis